MAYHFGKLGYMGMRVQDTAGTPETFDGSTVNEVWLPIKEDPDIKPIIEKEFPQYYKKSGAEASDYIVKRLAAEGNVAVDAHIEGPLEALLYGVFGEVDSTLITDTTTAYANIFTMVPDLPMWSIVIGRDELNMQRFNDVRFGSMEINMAPGENVSISNSVMGKGGDISQSDVVPTYADARSFVFDDVGVSLGGAPNCDVTEVSLTIDRGLQSKRTACAAAAKGDNVFYSTGIGVTGTINMFFQDYTEYSYWLGGAAATAPTFDQTADDTKRALTISMSGDSIGDGNPADNSAFVLTLPKIVYNDSVITMPWDDRMMVQFDFTALFDQTAETALAGTGVIKAQVDSDYDAETLLV